MSQSNPPDGNPASEAVVKKGRYLFFAVAVLTTAWWFPPDFSFLQKGPSASSFGAMLGIVFLAVQLVLLTWIWRRGSHTARKLLLTISLLGLIMAAVITVLLFHSYLTSGAIQRSDLVASYVLRAATAGALGVFAYSIAASFLMSKSLSAFVDFRFDKRISGLGKNST